MNKDEISDERLNAFADNQMDVDEKSRVFGLISEDEALDKRLGEIRKLQDLVKTAYKEPPRPSSRTDKNKKNPNRRINLAAAAFCLLLGLVVGWFAHVGVNNSLQISVFDKSVLPEQDSFKTDYSPNEFKNVILHLNSADPIKSKEILDRATEILLAQRESGNKVAVEVIANGDGLSLFNADESLFIKRIKQMQVEYPNLNFLACGVTADRYKKQKGRAISFIKGVIIAPSAVEKIVRRVRQGWEYQRI